VKPEISRLSGNINDMKSEMARTKSEMAFLNANAITQLKIFIETTSAQISVFNANVDSRLDKI